MENQHIFSVFFNITARIWDDFCTSIDLLFVLFFSEKKRTAERKGNLSCTWNVCNGIFFDTCNPLLWHDDRRTLLYRNSGRVLFPILSKTLFYKNYSDRNYQYFSCNTSNGDCIYRWNTAAGVYWMGNECDQWNIRKE